MKSVQEFGWTRVVVLAVLMFSVTVIYVFDKNAGTLALVSAIYTGILSYVMGVYSQVPGSRENKFSVEDLTREDPYNSPDSSLDEIE
jgi:ATP/ADP translocase